MLRAVLALLLIAVVAGLGFWFWSHATVRDTQRARVAEPAPLQQPPNVDTGGGAPPATPPSSGDAPAIAPPDPTPPAVDTGKGAPPPAPPQTDRVNPVPEGDQGDPGPLALRGIGLPVANLNEKDIHDSFNQSRNGGERRHEATDIMAPKGTPVVAVETGVIAKLFTSRPGGLTVYQYDPDEKYVFYYAHLDRYVDGLREGMLVRRGQRIGYVGATGNADPNAPHLHFAILQMGPEKKWYGDTRPVDPYPLLMNAIRGKRHVSLR